MSTVPGVQKSMSLNAVALLLPGRHQSQTGLPGCWRLFGFLSSSEMKELNICSVEDLRGFHHLRGASVFLCAVRQHLSEGETNSAVIYSQACCD